MQINGDLIISSTGKTLTQTVNSAFNHNIVKVLYNNASGSNANITLNDNVSNYDYIEIFFKCLDPHSAYASTKVHSPLNKKVCLIVGHETTDDMHTYYQWHKTVIIGTNSITNDKYSRFFNVWGTNGMQYGLENSIYITRVVGYKFI